MHGRDNEHVVWQVAEHIPNEVQLFRSHSADIRASSSDGLNWFDVIQKNEGHACILESVVSKVKMSIPLNECLLSVVEIGVVVSRAVVPRDSGFTQGLKVTPEK
jgi:hypothetical protein